MRFLNTLTVLCLLFGQISTTPVSGDLEEEAIAQAFRFLKLYQSDDGSWSGPIDVVGTAMSPWDVTPPILAALLWSGAPADAKTVQQALGYVAKHVGDRNSILVTAWSLMALSLAGKDDLAKDQAKLLLSGRFPTGGWVYGFPNLYHEIPNEPDVFSTELALIALAFVEAGVNVDRKEDLNWLTDQMHPDGGWGSAQESTVRETALAALVMGVYGYYQECSLAVAWLKDNQKSDGSWLSGGELPGDENLSGTAWAVIALSLLEGESDATSFGRAFLVNQQKPIGHWGYNLMTTALVLSALGLNAEPPSGRILNLGINYLILMQSKEGYWSDSDLVGRERLNRAYLNPAIMLPLVKIIFANDFELDQLVISTKEKQLISDYMVTLSALRALLSTDRDIESPTVEKAVEWILTQQQSDGSWFGNAQLTIMTVVLLQDAGLDPNMRNVRKAVAFTKKAVAFDMEGFLVRDMILAGISLDDPALVRYRQEIIATQTDSGAITGDLIFGDQDEKVGETAYYLSLLVDLDAPSPVIQAALSYVLDAQSAEGDWDGSFLNTLIVARRLIQANLASEEVILACEWLRGQQSHPALRYDDDFNWWSLYIDVLDDISMLPSVGFVTPFAKFRIRVEDNTQVLGGPHGGGPTIESTAHLFASVLKPPIKPTYTPIQVTTSPGEIGTLMIVVDDGSLQIEGPAAPWISLTDEIYIAGRRQVYVEYRIPENTDPGSYNASIVVGEQKSLLSIRVRPSFCIPGWIWGILIVIIITLTCVFFVRKCGLRPIPSTIITYLTTPSKYLVEIVLFGGMWGVLRSGGTYIFIHGGLLAKNIITTYVTAIILLGAALLWQLYKAYRGEVTIAVGAGILAGLFEYALLQNSIPWAPGTLTSGLLVNVFWGILVGTSGYIVRKIPLRFPFILTMSIILPIHLWLMGVFYPPYYPETISGFNATVHYPIPWVSIPLFSLALFFYGGIGVVSLLFVSLSNWLVTALLRLMYSNKSMKGRITSLFEEIQKMYNVHHTPITIIIILVGSLLIAFLVGFSEVWLIDTLDIASFAYLCGLVSILFGELAFVRKPKVFVAFQAYILLWVLAFAISEEYLLSFERLTDYLFIADVVGLDVWYKAIVLLLTSLSGSFLYTLLQMRLVRKFMSLTKEGLRKIQKFFANVVYKFRSTFSPQELDKRFEKFADWRIKISNAFLSCSKSPSTRVAFKNFSKISQNNLALNILLLIGFLVDTLGVDILAIFNAIKAFRWSFSNPFLLQFLLIELIVLIVLLGKLLVGRYISHAKIPNPII